MNTNRRTYRLDEVAEIIRRARFITTPELSTRLGVTIRTLNRDIQRLKQEFPQVYTRRGNGGGIGWDDGGEQ